MFDAQEHIQFRQSNTPTITNPELLGLTTVEINPTELCNRTCSFCPRSNPAIYPNRNLHMTTETAEKLVASLNDSKYDGEIHITGFGEPMLNPNILKIIKICSIFHTQLITNGDRLMEDNPSVEDLAEAGLQTLIVDCYDGDKQVQAVSKRLQSSTINARVRDHYDDGSNRYTEYNYTNRGGMMYETRAPNKPCHLPAYKAFVDFNGAVRLCCNDWQRNHNFGNIQTQSFTSIWNSTKMSRVRHLVNTSNRRLVNPCKNCDINGTLLGKDSSEIWKKHYGKIIKNRTMEG